MTVPRFLVLLLIGWYVSLTGARVAVWHDSVSLWADAVRASPLKPRPWINDGANKYYRGDLAGARADFQRAIHLADHPQRPWVEAQWSRAIAAMNLGLMAMQAGDCLGATTDFSVAMQNFMVPPVIPSGVSLARPITASRNVIGITTAAAQPELVDPTDIVRTLPLGQWKSPCAPR